MYFVYILRLDNGDLYKGSTKDLKQRLIEHKRGNVASTKNKNLKLIHYECYQLESDARRRELFLKTTEGRRLLKQQLRDILSANEHAPVSSLRLDTDVRHSESKRALFARSSRP